MTGRFIIVMVKELNEGQKSTSIVAITDKNVRKQQ